MQYASPWSRFLSALTDLVVLQILFTVASPLLPTAWLTHKFTLFYLTGIAIAVTYFLPKILFQGQTIGMWLFGYKVLKNEKRKRLTYFEEVLRFVSQWISIFLLFLPFLYVFFNRKKAHFSDLIVDSSPQNVALILSQAKPLQKFLGVFFVLTAVTGLFTVFASAPAVDVFGRILTGEIARMIQIGLVLVSFVLAAWNIFGWRRAALLTSIFYFTVVLSSAVALVDFNNYARRAIENIETQMTSAHARQPGTVDLKSIKGLIASTGLQVRKTLLPATKLALLANLACLLYMQYLMFEKKINPHLIRIRDFLSALFARMRNLTNQPNPEK